MLLYPFPTQSRPAPPHPTGIAERASFHSHLGKPRSRLLTHLPDSLRQSRASEAMPEKVKRHLALKNTPVNAGRAKRCPIRQIAPRRNEPHPDAERAKRCSYPTKGPLHAEPFPKQPRNAGRPGFLLSDSAAIRHRRIARTSEGGNRGARWEQNGLLTRGAAAACAARYRRVGAADAQSGRGIRDEDGPPPPRVREPRAYQDDRARSCPSRPPR